MSSHDPENPAAPEAAPSASTPSAMGNKKNLLIGAGCLAAATILGVAIGVPVSRAKKNKVTQPPQPDGSVGTEEPTIASAEALPFRFAERLSMFNPNVMQGYPSCANLLNDVQKALESLANVAIESGRDRECYWSEEPPVSPEYYADAMPYFGCPISTLEAEASAGADSASASALSANRGEAASTEDSFGTNNQVEGVEEADLIQSNGEFVFMGYGDEVIVMDLNGDIVDRVKVPLPPNATQNVLDTMSAEERSIAYPCGPPGPQYRTVKSLLLNDNDTTNISTLNVITTFDDWMCKTALCGGLTTAFVYQFDGSQLSLKASQDINGRYNNARAIGLNHHIATSANVGTSDFTWPLQRCYNHDFWNMTFEEYEQAAYVKANATVADFAQRIVDGLSWVDSSGGSQCQHIVQISSMTKGDQGLSSKEKRSLSLWDGNGVLQNFVQVTSFDVENDLNLASVPGEVGTISASSSGAFISSYDPEMYANSKDLVLAGRGYRYNLAGRYEQFTFLMQFDLSSGTAVPKAVGEATGYLNNQFSMDVYQDSLRVATTSWQQWDRVEDTETGDVTWEVVTNSTSQVTVYQASAIGNELLQTGFVGDLGEGEIIESVRFLKDRGYVVTFRTVDPLYSLDLSDPKNPTLEGELKISGFSEYMHPIANTDDPNSAKGDYLLTVGKEADAADEGRVTGTKISVFDVRDITSPSLVTDYVIDNNGGWSSSEASYDHFAFRYLDESQKLIIPLYLYDYKNRTNNSDGFVVYDVDIEGRQITKTGEVTHADNDQISGGWCWGQATLPSRSMVFKGDLMTFKSHSIQFTKDVNNLVGPIWNNEVNLDANRTKTESCWGYWPRMPWF